MDFFKFFTAMFSGINAVFSITLLALFVVSCVFIFKKEQNNFVKNTPSFMTSIGIFGTFFGIVIALLGFDGIDNIKEQIDVIISGMQTAFITSVLGLFLSILTKFLLIFTKEKDSDEFDAEELIDSFRWQTHNSGEISEKIDKLITAIGSDGENSMIGQIRLLRSDISDNHKALKLSMEDQNNTSNEILSQLQDLKTSIEQNHEIISDYTQKSLYINKNMGLFIKQSYQEKQHFEEKLWQEMNKVTETLSKSATEVIIRALKDVIADFNKNLTEQFGENFKELNTAVSDLVTWQENYKEQIYQMTEQYKLGITAIGSTQMAVDNIEKSTSSIPSHMDKLNQMITIGQGQLDELGDHLDAFAKIKDKAVNALPEIQGHIKTVLTNMEQGSENIKTVINNTANDFNQKTQNTLSKIDDTTQVVANRSGQIDNHLNDVINNLEKGLHAWQTGFEKTLNNLQTEFQKSVLTMTSESKELVRTQMNELGKYIRENQESTQQDINQILKDTQENMGNTQTKAIENMGQSLLSITKQFADDYSRLINDMQRLARTTGGMR